MLNFQFGRWNHDVCWSQHNFCWWNHNFGWCNLHFSRVNHLLKWHFGEFSVAKPMSYTVEGWNPSIPQWFMDVSSMNHDSSLMISPLNPHQESLHSISIIYIYIFLFLKFQKFIPSSKSHETSHFSWFNHVQPAFFSSKALLSDVVDLFATDRAFAALTASGQLVAWGDPAYGGKGQLSHVEMVQAGCFWKMLAIFFTDAEIMYDCCVYIYFIIV